LQENKVVTGKILTLVLSQYKRTFVLAILSGQINKKKFDSY